MSAAKVIALRSDCLVRALEDSIVVAELEACARHERAIAREHAKQHRHRQAIESLALAARHERDAEDIRKGASR